MSATKTHKHNAIEKGMRSTSSFNKGGGRQLSDGGLESNPPKSPFAKGDEQPKKLPILFSTPMVQAILDGRKTQTRRIVNTKRKGWDAQQHELSLTKNLTREVVESSIAKESQVNDLVGFHAFFKEQDSHLGTKCPYGQPGDLLWVRETWQHTKILNLHPTDDNYGYVYKADNQPWDIYDYWKWKPSIHMPKAAARIWLQVEEIRVERLQDISEADCIYEGITSDFSCPVCETGAHNGTHLICNDGFFSSAREAFQSLWHSINGVDSWNANPWLWVVKFKVLSTTGKPAEL